MKVFCKKNNRLDINFLIHLLRCFYHRHHELSHSSFLSWWSGTPSAPITPIAPEIILHMNTKLRRVDNSRYLRIILHLSGSMGGCVEIGWRAARRCERDVPQFCEKKWGTIEEEVSLPADGWRARGGSRGVEEGVPSLPFAQLTNDRLNKIAPAVLQEIFIKHACFSPDAKRAYWSTWLKFLGERFVREEWEASRTASSRQSRRDSAKNREWFQFIEKV